MIPQANGPRKTLLGRWGGPLAGPLLAVSLALRLVFRADGHPVLLALLAILAVAALAALIVFAVLDWQTRRLWRALGRKDA
jgi:hypothetical protein